MKNEKLGNKVSDTSPYLRINEACAFLRVSRSTLYRIIEKTGLEVLTGSGIRLLRRDDLRRVIEGV